MRVKLLQNVLHRWIIVLVENERLAWSGSRWVPIDQDGLPVGDDKLSSFTDPKEAIFYAENLGFEVQHG